jgi:hypothetical protein
MLRIEHWTLRDNPNAALSAPGHPGIYFPGSGHPMVVGSTISRARGPAGRAFVSADSEIPHPRQLASTCTVFRSGPVTYAARNSSR